MNLKEKPIRFIIFCTQFHQINISRIFFKKAKHVTAWLEARQSAQEWTDSGNYIGKQKTRDF